MGDNGVTQWRELVTSQIDALALLGNANCQLSQRRREMLKPYLNKEYASLCSSLTAESSLLFGDELQNQLASIRASNRTSNAAFQTSRKSTSRHVQQYRSWSSKNNNDREKPPVYYVPYARRRYRKRQQKPRRGANHKSL